MTNDSLPELDEQQIIKAIVVLLRRAYANMTIGWEPVLNETEMIAAGTVLRQYNRLKEVQP